MNAFKWWTVFLTLAVAGVVAASIIQGIINRKQIEINKLLQEQINILAQGAGRRAAGGKH